MFFDRHEPQTISEIIKVDVVGLPKLTLKELEMLEKSLADEKSRPKSDELDTAPTGDNNADTEVNVTEKTEQRNAIDLIKKLSKRRNHFSRQKPKKTTASNGVKTGKG